MSEADNDPTHPSTGSADPTFTFFTATFNRAATLHRVFDSLQAQTIQDFEWIVVDDGSSDDTRDRVAAWAGQATFPIRYFYQANSGKYIAFNRAVAKARGKWFLQFDSDDACTPDALATFAAAWETVPDKPRFVGVTARGQTESGALVGTDFPTDPLDSNYIEQRYVYKASGDRWGMLRTDVLRQYPFPELPGCVFLPEGLIWSKIARRYQTRYIDAPLLIIHQGQDQITRSRNWDRTARGMLLWHHAILNEEIDQFGRAPAAFLRSAVHYVRFSLHDRVDLLAQARKLKGAAPLAMWALAAPIGIAVYARDKLLN